MNRPTAAPLSIAGVVADAAWLTALFFATRWILGQTMGSSPTIWEDTLIENLFVNDCLFHNRCTAVGAGATVGIFHSATYLHFRSMLQWLGQDADATYRLFVALNAVGVVLVALTARRLAGRVAGAVAAVVMVASIGIPTQLNVISDVAFVPFLGAVFLLVAAAAVARPSLLLTGALGAVGGVMVNGYATGMLCGASALWIALLTPAPRRRTHAAVAVGSFAASTFLLSPMTWIVNAHILLSRPVGNAQHMSRPQLFAIPMAVVTAAAIGLWAFSIATRRTGLRRRLDVPAALFVPLFVPLALGTWVGRLDPQGKYFSHVIGAVAVAVGVGVSSAGAALWRRLVARLPRLAAPPAVGRALEAVVVVAAVAMIYRGGITYSPLNNVINFPVFKYSDLTAAERVIGRDHHWSWYRAFLNVRTPDELVRRAVVRWAGGWPEAGPVDALERAYLLKVPRHMIPRPMPANVTVAAATPADMTLVAFTCSWIDWREFTACVRVPGEPETCTATGIPRARDGHLDYQSGIPGMPNPGGYMAARQTLTLRFPLHPTAQCPETWVHMPQLSRLCPGRIVSVDGATSRLESDGRWVRLRLDEAPGAAPPRELAVSWDLGGPQCWNEFRGYPPFFLEGDPRTVAFVMETFDRQTGRLSRPIR
jgi:hypothetical protein